MISHRWRGWRPVLLSAALALVTTGVSMNAGGRLEHRGETIALQQAILRAEPGTLDGRPIYFPQFQNRILFPIVLASVVRVTALEPTRVYLVLRILSAWLAFWIVLGVADRLSGSSERATKTAALLAIALIVTFNHPWEHPTDVIDMAVFALAVLWTIEGRYRSIIALAVVASTNRESSVFLSLLWIAVRGVNTRLSRRLFLEAFVLGIVATATVIGLRVGVGGLRALAGPDMPIGYTIRSVRIFLAHPSPFDWPMGLLGLLILCAAAVCDRQSAARKGAIVIAAILMAGLSAVGGAAEELRIYIPAITVTIVGGAAS
jgi:hypothetical protein